MRIVKNADLKSQRVILGENKANSHSGLESSFSKTIESCFHLEH